MGPSGELPLGLRWFRGQPCRLSGTGSLLQAGRIPPGSANPHAEKPIGWRSAPTGRHCGAARGDSQEDWNPRSALARIYPLGKESRGKGGCELTFVCQEARGDSRGVCGREQSPSRCAHCWGVEASIWCDTSIRPKRSLIGLSNEERQRVVWCAWRLRGRTASCIR